MRIAIFTDAYPPFVNGVSTSSFNLANCLKANGHEVLVVAPRFTDGKLELIDNVLYVPGFYLKNLYGYRMTNIFAYKPLKIIKKFMPEVIHNQTDFTIGFLARRCAKKLKLPIVYTYHTSYEDYTYYVTRGLMDRFAKRFVRLYSKDLAKRMTEFITPSVKTKEYMRSVGSDAYINIIPTGIDFSIFKKEQIDQVKMAEFKKEHRIYPNTKVFLLVGRLAREKSMDVSLKCFAMYHQKYPEVDKKMLILGDGPDKGELKLLIEDLNIRHLVTFLGQVNSLEVPFYYHLVDIYTSASITETQGLTFMEAMAAGKIVLARFDSNLTGTIINGKTGFFFTDESSFVTQVEKIFTMTDEQKEEIINEAYRTVDTYSIDKFYKNILRVYKRAIRNFW
ncbi:MAG: glycosyltransferase family 4 protein [Erysipelotrichia bacterium]|nr:glycosyltransferase family 4 protein [Erysipelotrichia bacterium]